MRARKPYHNTNAGLVAFVTVCAVLDLAWVVLRPRWAIAAALGGVLQFATVLATVLAAVAMMSVGRTRARNVERLRAGDTWVRWPVDADLWARFMRGEWARGPGLPRRDHLLGALVVAPFAMLAGAIDGVALVLTWGLGTCRRANPAQGTRSARGCCRGPIDARRGRGGRRTRARS